MKSARIGRSFCCAWGAKAGAGHFAEKADYGAVFASAESEFDVTAGGGGAELANNDIRWADALNADWRDGDAEPGSDKLEDREELRSFLDNAGAKTMFLAQSYRLGVGAAAYCR